MSPGRGSRGQGFREGTLTSTEVTAPITALATPPDPSTSPPAKKKQLIEGKAESPYAANTAVGDGSSTTAVTAAATPSTAGSNPTTVPVETVEATYALHCGHYFCSTCWHNLIVAAVDGGTALFLSIFGDNALFCVFCT